VPQVGRIDRDCGKNPGESDGGAPFRGNSGVQAPDSKRFGTKVIIKPEGIKREREGLDN